MMNFLAAILIMGAAVTPQNSGSAPLSPKNFGTYMGGVLGVWAPVEVYEKEIPYARDLNIGITRMNTDCWDELEPSRGKYSWDKMDKIVDTLRRNDIDILFTVPISAKWNASGGPARVNNFDIGTNHFPAKDFNDIERFCEALAAHYKGKIKYYEAWNEPDLFIFWRGKPDVKEYTEVLKKMYAGLKRGDPGCKVLVGGIAYPLDDTFMKGLIKEGAFGYFDIMSIHAYSKSTWDVQRAITNTQNIVKWSGKDMPIWVTEVSTTPDFFKSGDRAKEEKDKAEMLAKFYEMFFNQGIEVVFWHTLRDCGTEIGMPKDFDFGLMTSDYKKLPAYDALKAFTTEKIRKN
ncbi:MAG: beta-galactosidase [Candidatus Omnitrophica bacterium]|nr:beta-galactosidase [Candidatus Omnitrophota bacterium]MDD5311217.1 beta-galactosidase [Candidatus Omnitrophota bacterium]MDD5546116.1 beta-galactosidase [Candidatus Omnitrophota bacterium]